MTDPLAPTPKAESAKRRSETSARHVSTLDLLQALRANYARVKGAGIKQNPA